MILAATYNITHRLQKTATLTLITPNLFKKTEREFSVTYLRDESVTDSQTDLFNTSDANICF